MKESCLLTSELEKTNEAYALAKISGLKYCEFLNRQYGTDYISVMPTNLYGPNDNYHAGALMSVYHFLTLCAHRIVQEIFIRKPDTVLQLCPVSPAQRRSLGDVKQLPRCPQSLRA